MSNAILQRLLDEQAASDFYYDHHQHLTPEEEETQTFSLLGIALVFAGSLIYGALIQRFDPYLEYFPEYPDDD